MEESSEKPVVSKRSKYFTLVKSSYSLRKTPTRSDSKPQPQPQSITNSITISSPEHSSSSNAAKSQAKETPKSPPRRYPSRVRVSAIQNLPLGSPKTPLNNSNKKKKEEEEEEEEYQESESRKRVKQTLRDFWGIHGKLIEEGCEKEQGERWRPDLVAYNIFKEANKASGSVNRCLGAVPGVEIGDKFELRVEMFLIGLHCVLQGNIDYVTRDDRLVACSIVFPIYGKYSNNVRMSGDVLVCCGSGTDKKDQKMEGSNLALKNSIVSGTPIRVVFGFRYGNRTMYVYGGLYSVEKYLSKKGHCSCMVFLFQLKMLEGQTKLNIKEIEKSMCSRTGGRYIKERDLLPSKCTGQENSALNGKIDLVEDTSCLGKRGREDEEVTNCLGGRREEEEGSPAKEAESRKRVKQTLHEFIVIYERLADEDEAKQKKVRKSGERSRFDLDAYNLWKDENKDLSNVARRLGAVPGVEVGDKFHFRVELLLLGLHCQLLADIDYIRKDERLLAVSVVSVCLGQYNTEIHKSDVLLFSGSGSKGRHQQMVKGNLALKNSIDAKTPVRVFNGFRKNKVTAAYVYYGLYLVEKHWKKKDDNGHYVFLFRLRRLHGQAKIDVKEVMKLLSSRSQPGHKYTEDISRGKEKLPIRAVNAINDERLLPFEYVTEVIYPSNHIPAPLEGCNCVDGCSDSDTCACAVRNGGEIPFNRKGAIVEAKPLVYECGPSCNCPPSCHNRVSQHGMKFPLEIFKTETMGWGVRCRTFIPSGSFICEYIGELLEDEEAQKRSTDEYLFAIGNNYYDESLWEGLSSVPCLQKCASSEAEEDGGFTVDAARFGNIGRFINHNCTPNLYAQNLLYDHDDKRMPHIMLFACEDIPPLQELTYHYNYTIDSVQDSEGNIRKKDCYCGSIECTGRLY